MPKIQRNDPCPCGSGLKYKRCCLLTCAFESGIPGYFRPVECDAERKLVRLEDIHTEDIYSVQSAHLAHSGVLRIIFSGVLGMRAGAEPVKPDTAMAKQIAAIAHKKYNDDWADTTLAMLDGKTPRQAIKNREARKRVLEILDQIDYKAGRADLNDPMHYLSSSHIRRELGLEEGASKG